MSKVLVIDDNLSLLDLLTDCLGTAGFATATAANGLSGLKAFHDQRPSLVLLDVDMPGMDGWTVASRIREVSRVPMIMLTAMETEEDKLRGFSLGVDDYVTKPFSPAEVVARVKATLALAYGPRLEQREVITSGDLAVDVTARRVLRDGEVVALSRTEFDLLAALALRIGHPVSGESLLDEVWGSGYEGELEHIKHYIWRLRQKLEDDPSSPRHILTERGFGYRFV